MIRTSVEHKGSGFAEAANVSAASISLTSDCVSHDIYGKSKHAIEPCNFYDIQLFSLENQILCELK